MSPVQQVPAEDAFMNWRSGRQVGEAGVLPCLLVLLLL
jgi:hypothetical protein